MRQEKTAKETAKELLLQLLESETQVEFYYNEILECTNARELFERVIMPLIGIKAVAPQEARKSRFYLTLARPMEERTGLSVNKSTLHGLIDKYLEKQNKMEIDDMLARFNHELPKGYYIKMTFPAKGGAQVLLVMKFEVKDPQVVMKMMNMATELNATFHLYNKKHFTSRPYTDRPTLQLMCDIPDVRSLLLRWKELEGSQALLFTYTDKLTARKGLTLDEIIDMLHEPVSPFNDFYQTIVRAFNYYNNFQIRLQDSPRYVLLPQAETEGQTVELNTRMEHLLRLHQLAAVDATTAGKAIAATMLFHAYMQKNMYTQAENVLAELADHMERLNEAAQAAGIPHNDKAIGLQMGFLLGHELAHICYARRPELLAADTAAMQRATNECTQRVEERPADSKLRLLRRLLPGVVQKPASAPEDAQAAHEQLEEMVCDYLSCLALQQILKHDNMKGRELARLCAHAALTLNILGVHQVIERLYQQTDEKLPPAALDFARRCYTVRQLVIEQVVQKWLHDNYSPYLASHYQAIIRHYGRHERKIIIAEAMQALQLHPDVLCPRAPYDSGEAERLDLQYRQLMGA